MKNIHIFSLILFFSITFFSCEKESADSTITKTDLPFAVENEDGILNFATQNDYEQALNYLVELESKHSLSDFSEKLNFKSFLDVYKHDQSKMDIIKDDIFASFLNPDCKVIIDNKLFEIKMDENQVLVWAYTQCDTKSSTDNILIGSFSCDDNVFELLENDSNLKSIAIETCPAHSVEKENQGYAVNNGRELTSYHYRVFYIKGGIYYTLNSRISQDYTKTTLTLESEDCKYKAVRQSETEVDDHSETYKEWSITYRPYWGLKRLDSYFIKVKFSAKDDFGATVFTHTLTDTCIQ